MLGRMPDSRRRSAWFALPAIDFVAASTMVAIVVRSTGSDLFPAFPIAPAVLVAIGFVLGFYSRPSNVALFSIREGIGWPALKVLVAGVLVWVTALMTNLGAGPQLALWAGFLALDAAVQAAVNPLLRRLQQPERWILVGDDQIAERLKSFAPLQRHARVASTIAPTEQAQATDRVAALEMVDANNADRVVIATRPDDDDEELVKLVRAFRSLGVPVSLLPRPLDLLEAPATTPSAVGGVPLIEVSKLAAREAVPYRGPDRRRDRRTLVSVVVPAMNEEGNIGHVLRRLPPNLHEVILVDGNSHDRTVEAALEAVPDIKVLTQSGRGKGDALRTGFAAVTGNLVVMLDADGSADPAEIPEFVAALEGGADFAKGSRFLPGGGSADLTLTRQLGNGFLSGMANVLHGTHFTDLCYGYNAFWARVLPFISLDVPGFEVETLINLRVAEAGMRITEVPSYEADRISGQSNLNTFRDGWRVLKTILRESDLNPHTRRKKRIGVQVGPDRIVARKSPTAETVS
jgi:Glycosyl transferase family 2